MLRIRSSQITHCHRSYCGDWSDSVKFQLGFGYTSAEAGTSDTGTQHCDLNRVKPLRYRLGRQALLRFAVQYWTC